MIGSGYELIKAFYRHADEVEAMQLDCKPHHFSLYVWICELRNRVKREVLDLPAEYTLKMSFVGSTRTLNGAVESLAEWGIIEILAQGNGKITKVKLTSDFLQRYCKGDAEVEQRLSKGSAKDVQTIKTSKKVINNENNETPGGDDPTLKKPYRDNVLLTEKEFDTLVTKHGQVSTNTMLDKLSAFKLSKGKKYDSDYGAINTWVVTAVAEDARRINGNRPVAPIPVGRVAPNASAATYSDLQDPARDKDIANGTVAAAHKQARAERESAPLPF